MKINFRNYSIGDFINQPGNPTEFEITRFEAMEEPDVDDLHKHTFYEIIWIERGRSRQTIDYKVYEIAPRSLFFISPNQIHEFEAWRPLVGGSIMFTSDFLLINSLNKDRLFELTFLDNLYANACVAFTPKEFDEVKHTIDLMAAEQSRKDKNHLITQGYLHILLAQVQRSVDRKAGKPFPRKYLVTYKQFQALLDIHFPANKTPVFYANQLHITQHHLNLIVRNVTGKTTGEVIRARSMLEAKRLLSFTDATVAEIAAFLNYVDSSYFAKCFKANSGLTPLAFKSKMSEKYRKG